MHHDLIASIQPEMNSMIEIACSDEQKIEREWALLDDVGELQAKDGEELRREPRGKMIGVPDRNAHLPTKRLKGFSRFAGDARGRTAMRQAPATAHLHQ